LTWINVAPGAWDWNIPSSIPRGVIMSIHPPGRVRRRPAWWLAIAICMALMAVCTEAGAIPLFNRQTGQNCVACHAGGQFPELTPYGRLFKLTGYTLGRYTVPLSAMAVASVSKVANTGKSDDPSADFQKDGQLIFATASVFLGGRITDNLGAFIQVTYDPYATQSADGHFHGHAAADNMDIRYADRFFGEQHELIVGVSVNNNPSVSDPWNTAPAWMQYVPVPSPTSSQFIDGNTPYPGLAAGGNTAGATIYADLDQLVYAEGGAYRTATGLFSFFKGGVASADMTRLHGYNPYWRVALDQRWGASSLMIGGMGMAAAIYDDPLDTSDPATLHKYRNGAIDAQYQYLLDPQAVTAQLVFAHQHHLYPAGLAGQAVPFVDAHGNAVAPTSSSDNLNLMRAKISYVWQASVGGSFSYFDLTGSVNTANQSSGYDPVTGTITSNPSASAPSTRVNGNLTGNPATRGMTFEAFCMPVQYLRLGLQFTAYERYNGASTNYDGFGRNAHDNNSVFAYAWFAY
jgi:hypothetical protein